MGQRLKRIPAAELGDRKQLRLLPPTIVKIAVRIVETVMFQLRSNELHET